MTLPQATGLVFLHDHGLSQKPGRRLVSAGVDHMARIHQALFDAVVSAGATLLHIHLHVFTLISIVCVFRCWITVLRFDQI